MATVTLDLPDELVARLGSGNVAVDVARIVALQLFRDGTVSLVKAAELARTPLDEFKVFARFHGVRPPDLTDEDEPSVSGKPSSI
jgi:predicted HTH domain antitoxin